MTVAALRHPTPITGRRTLIASLSTVPQHQHEDFLRDLAEASLLSLAVIRGRQAAADFALARAAELRGIA